MSGVPTSAPLGCGPPGLSSLWPRGLSARGHRLVWVVLATGAGTQTCREVHRVRTHHPRWWRETVRTLLATLTSPSLRLRREPSP